MGRSLSCLALACLVAGACDKKTPPPPPSVVDSGSAETVNGTERLGWQQSAADAVEVATFRYAIYVDGARSELTGASCARAQGSADFACTGRLPSMSAGAHTLELASFIIDGGVLESAKSSALRVTVTPASVAINPSPLTWPASIVTADGVRLRLDRVANGLADPSDIAFAPDGRMFVAERGGRIRVVRDGRLLATPALADDAAQFLAVAVDPLFDRTHFVSIVYTTSARNGRATCVLARFREASDTLADRVILLDDVAASVSDAAASLRFGRDGKLYVAFDDGGIDRLAADLASPSGKVLRLNPDGTTPDDQPSGSPLYSASYHSPGGFDWHPSSNLLWIADRDSRGSGRLAIVGHAIFALPAGTAPSSLAFYRSDAIPRFRDNLFVASTEGRHLLRLRLDPADPARVVSTERLLQDQIGGVRVVAIGPGGVIYVASSDAVGRLVADQGRR